MVTTENIILTLVSPLLALVIWILDGDKSERWKRQACILMGLESYILGWTAGAKAWVNPGLHAWPPTLVILLCLPLHTHPLLLLASEILKVPWTHDAVSSLWDFLPVLLNVVFQKKKKNVAFPLFYCYWTPLSPTETWTGCSLGLWHG